MDGYIKKPFSFEHQGPEGLSFYTPDDVSVGLDLTRSTSYGSVTFGGAFEMNGSGVLGVKLNF